MTEERYAGILRNATTLLAGLLGSLAILAYPLGFIVYWVQIWHDYTHDPTSALYATALIPVPVAAGRALSVAYVAFIASTVAATAASALAGYTVLADVSSQDIDEVLRRTGSASRFFRFSVSRVGRFVFMISEILMGAAVPWVFGLVVLNSLSDLFFYACATVIAGVGAYISVRISFSERAIDENLDSWFPTREIVIIAATTVVAAMFLIPLQASALASIEFSAVKEKNAALVAHSEGYWYVVEPDKRGVIALPDQQVGHATIFRH